MPHRPYLNPTFFIVPSLLKGLSAQLTTPALRGGARPPSEAGAGAGGEAAADPEGSRRWPRDRGAGLPRRASGTGRALLPRARQRQAPNAPGAAQSPCPPRTGSKRSWGGDAPASHASNTAHCTARPAARSHPRRRRRGRARPHLPAQLGERRPRPVGHGASPAAHRSTRGRRAPRGLPAHARRGRRDAGPARSPAPRASPGARAGQGEGAEGRKEEGRGGGGAGRDEQSPRPAAAWKLPPPWRGREGVRAAHQGSTSPAPAARGLPPCTGGKGLLKPVSSVNNIIDSSVVLEKALLRARNTRAADEEGFLEGSGAHVTRGAAVGAGAG